ncbi:MAG TPA: hypothetical protein VEW71_03475 [Allosphingosinicella sp.]|nr:hypothetical protein [Allosphingosinicella sp.]
MNVFDFITQDELDDLPHDDANLAFTAFVRHAQRRLSEHTSGIDGSDQEGWQEIQDARAALMNVVIAAAKRYAIEPFASMEVPRMKEFSFEDHQQFKADLDHYMTQLVLDNAIREQGNSVPLSPKAKDNIRKYVHGLRTCLGNAELTDAKRSKLMAKLAEFEAELDKRRLSFLAVTRITLEILALPGGVWATGDMVQKLVTNVLQIVAEAKAADDEARQLPPATAPVALSPPRAPTASQRAPAFDADLDDDVPF